LSPLAGLDLNETVHASRTPVMWMARIPAIKFPARCWEVSVEIAAVVLFGSVALWLADVIATRGPGNGA